MNHALPKWRIPLSTPHICLLVIYFFVFLLIGYWSLLPYYAERHYKNAYQFFVTRQYRLAITEYQQAIAYAPWEVYYQQDLARLYQEYAHQQPTKRLKMAYLKQSEKTLNTILKYEPQNPWIHNRYITLHSMMSQIDRSRDYTQLMIMHSKKSAELAPQNPLFQLTYAVHLHRSNQLSDAEHYYQTAIGYDPDLLDAHFNLGSLYYFQKRYTDALSHFLTIADKNPRYKDIYHWIASIYMIQNNIDKAVELFDTLDPSYNSAVLLDTQFRVYLAAKNWDKLIQLYEQYHGLYGHAEVLHNFYINALVQTQLKDNIIRAYQSLVEFLVQFPDNTLAKTQLSQIKPYIPNSTLKTL